MVIAIDCDNILNTLCEAVLSVYNEDAEDNLKPQDITSYHIENFVKLSYKKTFKNYFVDKRVWKRIKLVNDCQKYVAKLFNEGHKIIFCTSTEPENLKKKSNWLQRNFPYINIRKALFCCPVKQYLSGADILIDDYDSNFGGQKYSICYDYPWNQNFVETKRQFKAKNWEEIYNLVHKIEEIETNESIKSI